MRKKPTKADSGKKPAFLFGKGKPMGAPKAGKGGDKCKPSSPKDKC